MIKEEKLNCAILAIHDLLVWARSLAYEKCSTEILAKLLDEMECFPAFILENEDRTELFELHLKKICARYKFPDVWNRYRKSFWLRMS